MKNAIKKAGKAASTALITLLSVILILMIISVTGSVIYTLILLKSVGTVTEVNIKAPVKEKYSAVYMKNKNTGEYETIYKVTPYTGDLHAVTEYSLLPAYVPDAFVYTEDQRFYSHIGVDLRSTSAAVFCELLNATGILPSELRGGSTISQQLVKNITNDNEITPERKVREIIRSVDLEQNYTKEEILENYMNIIYFGQTYSGCNMYGIESAALGLFGKPASELTLAEAASLAAIPQNPERFSPVNNIKENENRRKYCLRKMFEAGVISPDEFESACREHISLNVSENSREQIMSYINDFENPQPTSWVTDTALSEFCDYICRNKEISREAAMQEFMSGGYEIYVTADSEIQSVLEEKYSDYSVFTYDTAYYTDPDGYDREENIQSAFVAMDYSGRILGITGGVGEKSSSFCWNNATDAHRQPGSTIKPLSVYGYVIENDLASWSTLFTDEPLPHDEGEDEWPNNYNGTYSHKKMTLSEFLKDSVNTLPAKICDTYGTDAVFSFVHDTMHLNLDPETDCTYASLSIGAAGTGPDLVHLTASYLPYGNGGMYFEPHLIEKIKDCSSEAVFLENETAEGVRAVSDETAFIMNRMLRNVVTDGTGRQAAIENTEICGKTGTTENYRDLLFVGLTPEFISAVWTGYENGVNQYAMRSLNSAGIWNDIIGEYAAKANAGKTFPECSTAVFSDYCAESGMPSGERCPSGGKGYFKSGSFKVCRLKHKTKEELQEKDVPEQNETINPDRSDNNMETETEKEAETE